MRIQSVLMSKVILGCSALLATGLVASPALADTPDGTPPPGIHEGPKYVVDPSWPKPLPDHWLIGQVGGLIVDQHDNIWVNQRPRSLTADEAGLVQHPQRSICCRPAPPVLEFDPQGHLLQAWGGPGQGYDWPTSEHGIWVDKENNVWVAGNGATDRQVLKFTNKGQFLLEIGHPSSDPINSLRTDILGQPAEIEVDSLRHEVYIADGYGNHRVIVYDSDTGVFKRMWGAYGKPPTDDDLGDYMPKAPPAQQFRNPVHCVRTSDDGLVYVCDRVNDRIQVFTRQGQFVNEFFVATKTRGNGSVWDLSFSHDRQQRYLLVADGENNVIWTLERTTGAVVNQQFRNGRNAGEFHWVHQMGIDSQGNVYTGEVDTSKRLQKFDLRR